MRLTLIFGILTTLRVSLWSRDVGVSVCRGASERDSSNASVILACGLGWTRDIFHSELEIGTLVWQYCHLSVSLYFTEKVEGI